MDAADVSMANTRQKPAATIYPGGEDENAEALLEANRYICLAANSHLTRLIASGWTDPKTCGVSNACRIVEFCVRECGFIIIKMKPAQNQYPIDSPAVLPVVDRIVDLGAVPAFHYGEDSPFTPAAGLEAIACRHPSHPLIGVDIGGGGGGYLEAGTLYH